jgi:hypothetical protein
MKRIDNLFFIPSDKRLANPPAGENSGAPRLFELTCRVADSLTRWLAQVSILRPGILRTQSVSRRFPSLSCQLRQVTRRSIQGNCPISCTGHPSGNRAHHNRMGLHCHWHG